MIAALVADLSVVERVNGNTAQVNAIDDFLCSLGVCMSFRQGRRRRRMGTMGRDLEKVFGGRIVAGVDVHVHWCIL
jgi:hypothetical protein